MSNIKIQDVYQRIQYTATASQTAFAVPFPFFANTDLTVWQDDDELDLGSSAGEYGVSGAGSPSGGTVTLVTGATAGDIITIQGLMPIDRTSIYSPTISNLTGTDLNNDFNRDIVMLKQVETTQKLLQLQYQPYAEVSQDDEVTVDRWLPVLGANQVWAKNNANDEIIAYNVPAGGGLAPDDATYLLQTVNSELPNAQAMGSLATGFVFNTTTTGVQATRIHTGTAGQIDVANGSGAGGNPTYTISSTLVLPGTMKLGGDVDADDKLINNLADPVANQDAATKAYVDGELGDYLPLAGGTMTGNIDMDGNEINNLAEPTADDDAATKIYVDNAVGGAAGGNNGDIQYNNAGAFGGDAGFQTDGNGNLTVTGSLKVDNLIFDGNKISPDTGAVELEDAELVNDLDAATNKVVNLLNPTNPQDAATKDYVDTFAEGLTVKAAVQAASTGAYTAVYDNGTAGVGATLTNDDTQAVFETDGEQVGVGQRVLIKDQANSGHNGIYVVTDAGSVSSNWVLTRATDFDQPDNIVAGSLVPVLNGTENGGTKWVQTEDVAVVGTDDIDFILWMINVNRIVTTDTTQTITGTKTMDALVLGDDMDADSNKIVNLLDPTSDQDAATKKYVDDNAGGGGFQSVQVFTDTGASTWTKPSGITKVKTIVTAGGGGGGSTASASGAASAGGGGAGGTSIMVIDVSAISSETITVGAGGAGGAGDNNQNTGATGGTSSFGAHCSATGGIGGQPTNTRSGGAGGTATDGDININGGGGGGGHLSVTVGRTSGMGGSSFWGGGGRSVVASNAGPNGEAFGSGGAGGSGNTVARAGGDGKDGIVIVYEYA